MAAARTALRRGAQDFKRMLGKVVLLSMMIGTLGACANGVLADDVDQALAEAARQMQPERDSTGKITHEANYEAAFRLFQKAANNQSALGQFCLGYLYESGLGTPQDDQAAFALYLYAANQRNRSAQLAVASMYESARGTPRDSAEALRWYRAVQINSDPARDAGHQHVEQACRMTSRSFDSASASIDRVARLDGGIAEQPVYTPPVAPVNVASRPAEASKNPLRVALIVGNGAYQNVPRLANAGNDALLVSSALQRLHFTLVGNGPMDDLDKQHFDAAVRSFGQAIVGAEVALFYYAGHGMQIQGENFLIPVDANPTSPRDLDFTMVDAQLVLRQMENSGAKLNIVILDACRNNPFGGRGLRDTSAGLAQMKAPEGTIISFATQPGSVALDGVDGNGPFAKAFSAVVQTPNLEIMRVFNDVGLRVKNMTQGAQLPWMSASPIEGEFYFAR